MTALLANLPAWTVIVTLVLARTGCAIMLLPGVGEADAPAITRAGIAVTMTVLLAPIVAPLVPPGIVDLSHFARALAAEMLTGIWLGWLARVVVLALPMAGQIIAHMIGISNVLQNEAGVPANTALSRLFTLAIPVLLLSSGLYALPLSALVNSYQTIPPGQFLPVRLGTELAITTATRAFALSLQLAAPFVGTQHGLVCRGRSCRSALLAIADLFSGGALSDPRWDYPARASGNNPPVGLAARYHYAVRRASWHPLSHGGGE